MISLAGQNIYVTCVIVTMQREARVTKKETKLLHKISRCRAASNVGPCQRIVPLSS